MNQVGGKEQGPGWSQVHTCATLTLFPLPVRQDPTVQSSAPQDRLPEGAEMSSSLETTVSEQSSSSTSAASAEQPIYFRCWGGPGQLGGVGRLQQL